MLRGVSVSVGAHEQGSGRTSEHAPGLFADGPEGLLAEGECVPEALLDGGERLLRLFLRVAGGRARREAGVLVCEAGVEAARREAEWDGGAHHAS